MIEASWQIGFPEKTRVLAQLDSEGVFSLVGTGDTIKFISEELVPWRNYRDKISQVRFLDEAGPVSINNWFYGCGNLTIVENLPDSVEEMAAAFCDCESLVSLPMLHDGLRDLDEAFIRCRSLRQVPVIPASVIYACDTFVECGALSGNMRLCAHLEQYAFMFQDACVQRPLTLDYAAGLEALVDAVIATGTDASNIRKGIAIQERDVALSSETPALGRREIGKI